jgi:hypothetical protein
VDYLDIETDDVDELFSWGQGWDIEFVQLSRGILGYRAKVVQLLGLSVSWNLFRQALLFRGLLTAPSICFAVVLDGFDSPVYLGKEVAKTESLLMQAGQEHEYRTHRNTRQFGETPRQTMLRSTSPETRRNC